MNILCLDLEGVLVPEIWIHVSMHTGIEELQPTTRDVRDYDILMKQRLSVLNRYKITLPDIQAIISDMIPIDGAVEFLEWLRPFFQLAIVSDTFYEFSMPLMKLLGFPMLFCHHLKTDKTGLITDYFIRQNNAKQQTVGAFQNLGYRVIAAGDSYNDIAMLSTADKGFFFRAPLSICEEFPQFTSFHTFEELKEVLEREKDKA